MFNKSSQEKERLLQNTFKHGNYRVVMIVSAFIITTIKISVVYIIVTRHCQLRSRLNAVSWMPQKVELYYKIIYSQIMICYYILYKWLIKVCWPSFSPRHDRLVSHRSSVLGLSSIRQLSSVVLHITSLYLLPSPHVTEHCKQTCLT